MQAMRFDYFADIVIFIVMFRRYFSSLLFGTRRRNSVARLSILACVLKKAALAKKRNRFVSHDPELLIPHIWSLQFHDH